MRGRKKTYVVALQPAEREDLRRLAAAHKTPQAHVRRARILLACDAQPEAGDKQIASTLGCSPETVRKWRKRWVETRSITDAPRTGRPRAFSP
ncbi:helix-turn-helix domain-containing protein [Salinibacter sp.]|uniref:helix-turn-helix domain-containing protein n=1 Tax=Salinibacter sp. TaxID=2065818 RepID=UPI003D75E781